MTRPVCVHCNKKYGQRVLTEDTVCWDAPTKLIPEMGYVAAFRRAETGRMIHTLDGDPPPPPRYRGNQKFIRDGLSHLDSKTGQMVIRRYVWDGESWSGGYPPFCTMNCALDYARKAWKQRGGK